MVSNTLREGFFVSGHRRRWRSWRSKFYFERCVASWRALCPLCTHLEAGTFANGSEALLTSGPGLKSLGKSANYSVAGFLLTSSAMYYWCDRRRKEEARGMAAAVAGMKMLHEKKAKEQAAREAAEAAAAAAAAKAEEDAKRNKRWYKVW